MPFHSDTQTPVERLAVVETMVVELVADVKPLVAEAPTHRERLAWVVKLQWANIVLSLGTFGAIAGLKTGALQAIVSLF